MPSFRICMRFAHLFLLRCGGRYVYFILCNNQAYDSVHPRSLSCDDLLQVQKKNENKTCNVCIHTSIALTPS